MQLRNSGLVDAKAEAALGSLRGGLASLGSCVRGCHAVSRLCDRAKFPSLAAYSSAALPAIEALSANDVGWKLSDAFAANPVAEAAAVKVASDARRADEANKAKQHQHFGHGQGQQRRYGK